mgnify:CR=1 FL=1
MKGGGGVVGEPSKISKDYGKVGTDGQSLWEY